MSINPTDPGSVERPSAGRLRKAAARTSSEQGRATGRSKDPSRTDQVEISDGARQLLEANGVPSGDAEALTPAQLREVLDRIAGEFYERPEVRDQVIRRILPQLREG